MGRPAYRELEKVIEALKEENDELKEALYLYAVRDNWHSSTFLPMDYNIRKGVIVYGKSARKALGIK